MASPKLLFAVWILGSMWTGSPMSTFHQDTFTAQCGPCPPGSGYDKKCPSDPPPECVRCALGTYNAGDFSMCKKSRDCVNEYKREFLYDDPNKRFPNDSNALCGRCLRDYTGVQCDLDPELCTPCQPCSIDQKSDDCKDWHAEHWRDEILKYIGIGFAVVLFFVIVLVFVFRGKLYRKCKRDDTKLSEAATE